jgi:hypothetical protein
MADKPASQDVVQLPKTIGRVELEEVVEALSRHIDYVRQELPAAGDWNDEFEAEMAAKEFRAKQARNRFRAVLDA